MNMKWHFTTTRPQQIQHCVAYVVLVLMMTSAQARPFTDSVDIDSASRTVSQPALIEHLFDDEFAKANRTLFTRDLALGGQSVRDLSLTSFVKASRQGPPVYGRDFLFNPGVFERELFASVSAVAVQGDATGAGAPWLDTTGLQVVAEVEASPTSRASVPEPRTLMLVAVGILGLVLHRRRTNWAER